jgi:hypothetical protein
MNIAEPSNATDQSQPLGSSEPEEQIRETIRSGAAPAPEPQAGGGSEIAADNSNALLRQIAGTVFKDIDRLIDELHAMRDYLRCEGLRIQREIVKYAQLSQAAMKSTKVITEGMTDPQDSTERLH